jgi:hypothetical protein
MIHPDTFQAPEINATRKQLSPTNGATATLGR